MSLVFDDSDEAHYCVDDLVPHCLIWLSSQSLLEELHKQGLLHAQCKWKDLFPLFQGRETSLSLVTLSPENFLYVLIPPSIQLYFVSSEDPRFTAMLGKTGSTPLDLFKLYTNDLYELFLTEMRVVKDIIRVRTCVCVCVHGAMSMCVYVCLF